MTTTLYTPGDSIELESADLSRLSFEYRNCQDRETLNAIAKEIKRRDSQVEALVAALREAVRLYENYSLVAQPVEGEGLNVGKWVSQAREAIDQCRAQRMENAE